MKAGKDMNFTHDFLRNRINGQKEDKHSIRKWKWPKKKKETLDLVQAFDIKKNKSGTDSIA